MRCLQLHIKQPHRLSRLVLLSPAGFVKRVPLLVWPIAAMLPFMEWAMRSTRKDSGLCMPFHIPTTIARSVFFRLAKDAKSVPAVGKLARCASAL